MKRYPLFFVLIASVGTLFLIGCPSPAGMGGGSASVSTARVVMDAESGEFVFVDDDGTETPIVAEVDGAADAPVELIDYAVLDDGDGRFAAGSGLRCLVVGRRQDGRSGVWAVYRGRGVLVIPNADGIEDSALLELVELQGTPWLDDDWVYEASAISDDGKIIIGNLSRPDGWDYLGDDAPAPEIGIWWSVFDDGDDLVISRAMPILLFFEPEETDDSARCAGEPSGKWLEKLIEMAQALILELSWNYLAEVDGFVDAATLEDLDIDVPEGQYPVSGVDKHGTEAWAWLTAFSVLDIEDAPEGSGGTENRAPWPVSGPAGRNYMNDGASLFLQVTDDEGNLIVGSGPFDPDGDDIVFDPVFDEDQSEQLPQDVFESVVLTISPETGELTLNWASDGERYDVFYDIYTDDGTERTAPLEKIQLYLY